MNFELTEEQQLLQDSVARFGDYVFTVMHTGMLASRPGSLQKVLRTVWKVMFSTGAGTL